MGMRTEQEMYDFIIRTAKEDERICAVYMNGSRTNPNAPKDIFMDYDIVYVVHETESFMEDKKWIDRFGERMFMQYPEDNTEEASDKHNFYGWLIQFADGNRLDLHVETVAHARENIVLDSLCIVLLDKENILPVVPESTDKMYWVKKPSKIQYLSCCNEFWWCLDNVAKGLWRKEVPYVQDMLNFYVRKELERILSWKVGVKTEFSVSIGKSGKYMYRWLSETEWKDYLATYSSADIEECWNAVMKMCDLFQDTAIYVGESLGYEYNQIEGRNARSYLEHVRSLPEDAVNIY